MIRSFSLAILFLSGVMLSPLHAQMPSMPHVPGLGSVSASGLSDSKIAAGLKEALSVGTQKAVKQVDQPGGYLNNQAIRILLPANLRPVESVLRSAGQGPKIDAFVASMNHAAESAAPEAENIFADAVTSMTIDDARKLLNGNNTAITDYFRKKTSASLTAAFRPHVEKAMQANGVMQQYEALAGKIPAIPFMKQPSLDINSYVVSKALDGLFYMLGQEEKKIRTDPAARSTELLKQVFGK